MPFIYKKSLLANSGPVLVKFIITGSETVTIGDQVLLRVAGTAAVNTGVGTQTSCAGIVHDIIDAQGNSVFGSIAVLGLATVSSGNTCTVGATNATVDQIAVLIDVCKYSIYSATVTGTIGTTTTSNNPGGWIQPASTGDRVTETTHTRTIATGGSLKCWGTDPNDSTRLLVSIARSEILDPTDGLALT
jgi:hypothetical protein